MKNTKVWWFLAILWCVVIAIATRQPFFTGDSTEELLTNPLFDSAILNFVARKLVHISAFGLLAFLFWRALRGRSYRYVLAFGLATLYGAIDEWHQSFIPDRSGAVTDVFINSFGACLVLVLVYSVMRNKRLSQKQ
ncbi:VanZ family protein [Halalkalibacter kiskunsagensis]|uniref:VanZ family protein n=1 Tax=Halalkalibacter kiskunsagensis TaxID=1548599 RepID=A0ABV6KFC1_9BACI